MAAARLTNRRAAAMVVPVVLALAVAVALCSMFGTHRTYGGTRIDRGAGITPRPSAPPAPPAPAVVPDLSFDEARASNAAVKFVPGPILPALPFRYVGTVRDREAATVCLAVAILYEAGDDPQGEAAVAQVVLNRLRHPAFPKTVCGVIFQGSERSTGCQFTFTCDDALNRPARPDPWRRAHAIAEAALSGVVFAPVGTATHYHTNWVVPYWRGGLDKVAQVHTQIFYRWPGWWGTRAAFTGQLASPEPIDARIAHFMAGAALEDGDRTSPGGDASAPASNREKLSIEGVPDTALKGSIVRMKDDAGAQFLLLLDGSAFPGSWALVGYSICATRPACVVMGWTADAQIPRTLPVPAGASSTMAFLYRRGKEPGQAQFYWDCTRFPRADKAQCLPPAARR